MTSFEKKQALLATEFDRYVMEHPDFAARIPSGAQILIELEGDESFNAWARSLAEKQREKGRPLIRVKVRRLMPIHSRLEDPVIEDVLPQWYAEAIENIRPAIIEYLAALNVALKDADVREVEVPA